MLAGGLTILKGSPNSTELRAGGAMVMEATSGVTALYVDGVPALRANHNGQTGITLFNPNTGYTAFESSYYTNTKIYAPNNDVRISISADKTSIMRPVTGGDAIEID
jgi:hypothetical protein